MHYAIIQTPIIPSDCRRACVAVRLPGSQRRVAAKNVYQGLHLPWSLKQRRGGVIAEPEVVT